MGCSPFRLSSSNTPDLPRPFNNQDSLSFPNPDPLRYEILEVFSKKDLLLIKIRYLDCVNYEGNKVLLYQNTTLEQLTAQKHIDPHFSENTKYHSPIARFEPTDKGWLMAKKLINLLSVNKKQTQQLH